jgi:hypothetical protein
MKTQGSFCLMGSLDSRQFRHFRQFRQFRHFLLLGHSYFEFGICLEFDAWNLGFQMKTQGSFCLMGSLDSRQFRHFRQFRQFRHFLLLGHSYFEFEICLEFDAWNLGFRRFRERSQETSVLKFHIRKVGTKARLRCTLARNLTPETPPGKESSVFKALKCYEKLGEDFRDVRIVQIPFYPP